MKISIPIVLVLALVAASPSPAAIALCAANVNVVTNGAAGSGVINCPAYTPPAGYAVQQYGLRALFAYQTTVIDNNTGMPPAGTVSVALTGLGPAGGLIPPATLTLPVTGFAGNLPPTTVAMTSLTLAVAGLAGVSVGVVSSGTGVLPDNAALSLWLVTEDTLIGSSQINPVLPSAGTGNSWTFTNGVSGLWYDPPLVNGYDYAGLGGTTFTQIGLPTGFSSPFDVYSGNTLIGSFAGGSMVDFVALMGGPLSSFRVSGINPLVDGANPAAFPLQVFFSTPTGSFTQTGVEAVPEPASWALLLVGALALGGRLRQRA